jgi:hypothetical protein
LHVDVAGALDDVVVGQQKAISRDDDAGAQADLGLRPALLVAEEEILEPRVA